MATIEGRGRVSRYLRSAPERLARTALRAAARTAVDIIADEAKLLCRDDEVAAAIKTKVKVGDGVVTGKVLVKGKGDYKARWLEYGTSPHYISVSDAQRQGRSVNRINKQGDFLTLVINGKPVGPSVFHPGARPYPFLRPALDGKQSEAIAAAQARLDRRSPR